MDYREKRLENEIGRAGAYVEFTNTIMQRAICKWASARDGRDTAEAESLRALSREFEAKGVEINRAARAAYEKAVAEGVQS